MKKLGLLGCGIGYSLSPKTHAIILDYLGIKGTYDLIDIPALDPKALEDYDGFNVTKPYKQQIIPLLAEFEGNSVNTVVRRQGGLVGSSTDAIGLRDDLARLGHDIRGSKTLLLGSGGFCQAVRDFYGDSVDFVSLSRRTTTYDGEPIDYCISGLTSGVVIDFSVIDTSRLRLVYDAGYHPRVTPLMQYFADKGIAVANGVGMLIFQAIQSERVFCDVDIDSTAKNQLYKLISKEL